MPVNDGAWFLQKFRVPRKTKVLLITAFVDREVIRKMFSLGASGYLIKPFEKEDLLRHMNFLSPARAVASHAS
jgi:response regulator of citrate/malate metabolism